MKSSLAYWVAFLAFSIVVFSFVFWKVNNTDFTLKNVKIKIELSATLADEFGLYYSNNTYFDGERKLSLPVTGSSKIETLNFELPGDNNNFILLSLSKNIDQTNMSIYSITFESNNKTKTYKGGSLKENFRTNKFVKTATLNKNKVDYTFASINEHYDPIYRSVYLQQIF